MKSINFPKMFNQGASKIIDDKNNYKAIIQAMKLIILSDCVKGLDYEYGVNLRKFYYEQNNGVLMDVLRETIFEKLVLFLGRVIYLKREWITFERDIATMKINIKFKIKSDYTEASTTLVLFGEEE